MQVESFAIIGGDLRFSYLAGLLAADAYRVLAVGFDHLELPPCVTGCTNAAQAVGMADAVVLPMPVSTDSDPRFAAVNAPFARGRILLDGVLGAVRPGQVLLGGALTPTVRDALDAYGLTCHDYLAREELAIHNAVPTAEGAVFTAMSELPITLRGASTLVAGYGRIGQTLSRLLLGMGARVAVATRDRAELAWASCSGCEPLEWSRLEAGESLPRFDAVFNTVPALVFTQSVLARLDGDTLLIDLASRPGGVDFAAASALGIKTVWALSLPGRVAPKSAGGIIKNTLLGLVAEL